MSLSQDAGSIAAASLSETQPVPESSPPSPEKGLELSVADLVARLTALEEALKKEKEDNAKLEQSLRESIAKNRQQEGGWQNRHEEEEWHDDAPEVNENPMSYMMTPQKPPGNLEAQPWQDDWAPVATARNTAAEEDCWWPSDGERKYPGGQQWCQPAWGTTWQLPQQCDPWAMHSRSQQSSRDQGWSSSAGGNWQGQWNGGWDNQWSQPFSQWKDGWGGQWSQPLRQPDRKDVDRPAKYAGDITKLLQWSKSFIRFLRRQDWRWPQLLEKIQGLRGRPVTASDEDWWSWQLNLGDIGPYKDYLNEYMLSFTDGTAWQIVNACGETNALDAWRQLTERADSLRPAHVKALQKTAMYPRENVQAKDLEIAVAQWEGDVQRWEFASNERMQDSHRRLCLEDMCPERLKTHLKLVSDKLPTYEAIRAEIADWLAEDLRKPARQRAAAIGPAAGTQQEWIEAEDNGDWDPDVYNTAHEDLENFDREQLMALVKNTKSKQSRKGAGKGGKGGKGPRT